MIVTIKAPELKIGMFIDISSSWYKNPFWVDKFTITSDDQINKILDAGIEKANVDTIRSKAIIKGLKDINNEKEEKNYTIIKNEDQEKKQVLHDYHNQRTGLLHPPPDNIFDNIFATNSDDLLTSEIKDAIRDIKSPPDIRARIIYRYGLGVMKYLFNHPEPEVIKASKKELTYITEMIVAEPKTASFLINVVSNDKNIFTHCVNVGIKATLLAISMYGKTDKYDLPELGANFFLHDIGATKIDTNIVNKPGKVTDEEFEQIKLHPFLGYKILDDLELLNFDTWTVTMHHHERADGSGYPSGIKKNDIHPFALICGIADVYDALTSRRLYRTDRNKPVAAIKIIMDEMLPHFGSQLLTEFVLLFKNRN